jgi:molybdopterin/thiamine biosynthesis adenylyltransferase
MERYSRHIELIGEHKFGILRNASVMVAGAGGLGCTVLSLLARMGVGTIHFFEFADIDLPDLNRQILYDAGDIGKLKSVMALEKLQKINPDIEIIAHCEKITPNTIIPKVDLVFDCLDNFTSRYVLDDLVFPKGIPMVHAGVGHYFGQLTVIIPGKTECLRRTIAVDATKFDANSLKTIYPPVVTVMASLQVSEAVKYLTGDFEHLIYGKILIIDLLSNTFEIVELE